MLIQAIIIACSIAEPTLCSATLWDYQAKISDTPATCARQAAADLTPVVEARRPGFKVRRVTCRFPVRVGA